MNTYTTYDFKGHNPVGSVAVVVARDRGHARRLLSKKLQAQGLALEPEAVFKKLDTENAEAHVLLDGEY